MLTAVVRDIATAQSPEEQSRKSKGHGRAHAMRASGRLHADHRIQHGFTFRSVIAEFRALRATVLRLYETSGASDLTEVRRFNEAVDEALTESMEQFAEKTDLFRDQFIGVFSHDLRAPLGAIIAGTALLAVPEDNPQRRGRVVTRMMRSAQRMERMIGADLGGGRGVERRRREKPTASLTLSVDRRDMCKIALAEPESYHEREVCAFNDRRRRAKSR